MTDLSSSGEGINNENYNNDYGVKLFPEKYYRDENDRKYRRKDPSYVRADGKVNYTYVCTKCEISL